MSFVLDSGAVDEVDRAEFVHEALGTTLVPIELHWPRRRQAVAAQGVISDLGDLTICTGRTSALRVKRTPPLARDDMEPSVFVHVQVTGSTIVVQRSREVTLHPGELVIYDCTEPYTLLSGQGVSGEFFRIPHAALALPHDMIRQTSAMSLSPGHPLTSLTHDFLRRLAADPALLAAPQAELVGHPSIELIRAVVATHLRQGEMAADPLASTLPMRILEYVRTRLHDPDLSAEQIAAAHHISIRYLYKVLATRGISLAEWIRTHRLEASRHALTQQPRTTPIAAVARRHGFTDISSFSRAFRTEYGLTPSEWRERHTAR